MKKISDVIINERLKIDKNTKIFKPLKDLKKGDKAFIIRNSSGNKIKIYPVTISSDGLIDFDSHRYALQYEEKSGQIVGIFINKTMLNNDSQMSIASQFNITLSTSKELIEDIFDKMIDNSIEPYQNEIIELQNKIDEYQKKIDEILKEKENKWYEENE